MKIRLKLLLFFIVVKVIPVVLLAFIAYIGTSKLELYLEEYTNRIFKENITTLQNTTNETIDDSIKQIDKKSQELLEKITFQIANHVSEFLYERDNDILYLSKQKLDENTMKNFFNFKVKSITVHDKYVYNEKEASWEPQNKLTIVKELEKTILPDNKKEFNSNEISDLKKIAIPIYKEVSFFDVKGDEKYKISTINKRKVNVFDKTNTYLKAENFKNEVELLRKNDIYVSDVIGEYVSSKFIGKFTKEKADKLGVDFNPEENAYAGKENPVGKRFEGIVRFITPVYKENKKIGYLSLALDHRHIMEFTDSINPTGDNIKQDISDASLGNYAFMWDQEGRNITHPRNYFIMGYDSNTGERVPGWISKDIQESFKASKEKNLNLYLNSYPKFQEQSSNKKPNIEQIKKGQLGLDCRYLNFAPQCQGWMELTKNGGYGSFMIYWSNVWKLTTAATIPYYTGKYKNSKRGFGFVTIGANVDDFHKAANETKDKINEIVNTQVHSLNEENIRSKKIIKNHTHNLIQEITITTFVMIVFIIFIAVWMSRVIVGKIENLIKGTKKFANNEFDYKIKVSSKDEIGLLESSFNDMADKIKNLMNEQKVLNENLEKEVISEVEKQRIQEKILIQQSKLASMGEMLGNIAHQWRQPLNALGLNIQSIEFLFYDNNLDKDSLSKIVDNSKVLTKSMSKTIDDFTNFYKPNKKKHLFNLDDTIAEVLALFRIKIGNFVINIKKEVTLEKSVFGFNNELMQVLLNILLNAKDSFAENKIASPEIEIKIYRENNYGCISIKDNSVGIPSEYIDKIFEPYFTTKFNGTGIGLYMSKVIIEQNIHGELLVESSNEGTIFYIKVPFES